MGWYHILGGYLKLPGCSHPLDIFDQVVSQHASSTKDLAPRLAEYLRFWKSSTNRIQILKIRSVKSELSSLLYIKKQILKRCAKQGGKQPPPPSSPNVISFSNRIGIRDGRISPRWHCAYGSCAPLDSVQQSRRRTWELKLRRPVDPGGYIVYPPVN